MEKEQNLRKENKDKKNLLDYINENSNTLVNKEYFTEELGKLAKPGKAMIGYYDSDNVNFSVEGYDFVYFDEDKNLKHVKIAPDELLELKRSGKLHENDDLVEELKKLALILISQKNLEVLCGDN